MASQACCKRCEDMPQRLVAAVGRYTWADQSGFSACCHVQMGTVLIVVVRIEYLLAGQCVENIRSSCCGSSSSSDSQDRTCQQQPANQATSNSRQNTNLTAAAAAVRKAERSGTGKGQKEDFPILLLLLLLLLRRSANRTMRIDKLWLLLLSNSSSKIQQPQRQQQRHEQQLLAKKRIELDLRKPWLAGRPADRLMDRLLLYRVEQPQQPSNVSAGPCFLPFHSCSKTIDTTRSSIL